MWYGGNTVRQRTARKVNKKPEDDGQDYTFTFKSGDTVKMKRDSFWREREKTAEMWDILCSNCRSKVLLYQKDGRGKLHRCYLNRIFDPPSYAELQDDVKTTKENMPTLTCRKCQQTIGYPMMHREGRLAYFLLHGKWTKQKSDIIGV